MEDNMHNFDIFYQINSYDDIQEYKLKNIKDKPYFLIESNNINPKNITFEYLEHLLKNDGVDLSIIQEFRYLIEEERNNKINFLLKPLSNNNLSELTYLNQIYLHLIIEDETETPETEIINEEMDEYNIKIEKYEKNIEEISNGIRKEEMYNNIVLSDSLFKDHEKKKFSQSLISNDLNIIMGKKNFIYNSFSFINEEKNFNIDDNNINDFNNSDKHLTLSLDVNREYLKKNTYKIDKKEKSDINLCYLYSNPLLLKDNKKLYKDNDCFNEIVSIYDIFKNSNFSANLKFEPIINNFNTYLESTPDILHINVNSTFEKKKLLIDLDYMGELQHYRCEDLKLAIGTEYGLSQIKLLILSSQNIEEMKKYFNDIGIKNIIYIEKKITYPKPNEQEENFIKE